MNYARTTTLFSGAIAMTLTLGAANISATWLMTLAIAGVAIVVGGLALDWRTADARLTRRRLTGWPRLPIQTIVRELAKRAEVPAPNLFLVDTDVPNAFTTGRNRPSATIALTAGLLASLSEREIRGVLAHEIAHIVRRDARRLTVMAILCGLVAGAIGAGVVATWATQDRGLVTLLVMIIIASVAGLSQMAICRSREFSADRLGAALCGNPLWIADALERIDALDLGKTTRGPRTWALETFQFGARRDRFLSLFSTHPPSSARILRLHRLAGLSNPWD